MSQEVSSSSSRMPIHGEGIFSSYSFDSYSSYGPIHVLIPIIPLRAHPSNNESFLIHDIPSIISKRDVNGLYTLYQIPNDFFQIVPPSLKAQANGPTDHRTLMVYKE